MVTNPRLLSLLRQREIKGKLRNFETCHSLSSKIPMSCLFPALGSRLHVVVLGFVKRSDFLVCVDGSNLLFCLLIACRDQVTVLQRVLSICFSEMFSLSGQFLRLLIIDKLDLLALCTIKLSSEFIIQIYHFNTLLYTKIFPHYEGTYSVVSYAHCGGQVLACTTGLKMFFVLFSNKYTSQNKVDFSKDDNSTNIWPGKKIIHGMEHWRCCDQCDSLCIPKCASDEIPENEYYEMISSTIDSHMFATVIIDTVYSRNITVQGYEIKIVGPITDSLFLLVTLGVTVASTNNLARPSKQLGFAIALQPWIHIAIILKYIDLETFATRSPSKSNAQRGRNLSEELETYCRCLQNYDPFLRAYKERVDVFLEIAPHDYYMKYSTSFSLIRHPNLPVTIYKDDIEDELDNG